VSNTGDHTPVSASLCGGGKKMKLYIHAAQGIRIDPIDTVYAPCACSPLGKVQKISMPYQPGAATINWTVYRYDGLGRTLSVTQPDGASTTTYVYSGNQTTVTDPAGKWKTFTTDVQGNLTTVTEPDPSSATGGTLTTS